MKKQTFLHKLTNWLAALGFAAVCGCMAIVNNQVEKASAYTVQKAQESVTFTKEELNNCNYSYLVNLYSDLTSSSFSNSYIKYGEYELSFSEFDGIKLSYFNDNLDMLEGDEGYIYFNHNNNGKWILYDVDLQQNVDFEYSLTIYSDFFAENMQKSITLSASKLNNNTYKYFSNYVNEEGIIVSQMGYCIYNNIVLIFDEDTGTYNNSYSEDDTYLYMPSIDRNYKFVLQTNDHQPLTINNSITFYSNYIADNINAPFTDGDDIIGGITSGLGLISYLATTFLNGFTGLFWQNNALTNFAMYSLIMLGIAICFSVIKLCMNVMRSNTGA